MSIKNTSLLLVFNRWIFFKRPSGLQIQWRLLAILLFPFIPPKRKPWVGNDLGVILKMFLHWELRFVSKNPDTQRDEIHFWNIFFTLTIFRDAQALCLPLWRIPSVNTWIIGSPWWVTSCHHDQITFSERIALINAYRWCMIFFSLPGTHIGFWRAFQGKHKFSSLDK